MRSRIQFPIPRLLVISFVLIASPFFFYRASAQTIPDTDADLDALKASIMLANAGKPCARGTCSEVLCQNAIAVRKALDEARIATAVMLSKFPEAYPPLLKRQMELNKEYERNSERDKKLRLAFIWSKAFSSAGKLYLAAAELLETKEHFDQLLDSSPDETVRRLTLMAKLFKDLIADVNAIHESLDELETLYQNPEDKPLLVKIRNEKEYYISLNTTLMEAIRAFEEVKRLEQKGISPLKLNTTLGKITGKALLKVAAVEQDKLIDELRDIAVLQKALDANYYLMVRDVSRIRDRRSYIQKLRDLVGDVITQQNVCLAKCPDAPGLKAIPDLSATPWEKVVMAYNAKLPGITADITSAAIRPMIKGGTDPQISASPQTVNVGETVSSKYSLAECADTEGAHIELMGVSRATTDEPLGLAKRGAPTSLNIKAPELPGDYAVKIVDRHSRVLASATFSVVLKPKEPKPTPTPPKEDLNPKKSVPTNSFPGFSSGKYQGHVEIEKLSECSGSGKSSTGVYLTVAPQSVVMLLRYFQSNTDASNYFESKEKRMTLEGNHMIGGILHGSKYYFDVNFSYDSVKKQYVGKGTWIIQDECEAKSNPYPVTITLAPVADFHY